MQKQVSAHKLIIVLLLLYGSVACRRQADVPQPTQGSPTAMAELILNTPTLAPTPTIAPTATVLPWPDLLEAAVSQGENLNRFSPQAPFALQFNQPIDTASVNPPLLVSPFVEGRYQWDNNATHLTFIPENGFIPGQTYSIVLDSRLSAASGRTFHETQQWQIQVVTPPKMSKRRPLGPVLASRRPEISLDFDREMDPDSVAASLVIEPDIPFNTRWDGNRLQVELLEALIPGSRYTFSLGQGAVDSQGVPLAQEYQWQYQVRPLVAYSRLPAEGQQSPNIIIGFNYPMDTASVGRSLRFIPAIVGDLTWSEDQKQATFTPAGSLGTETSYTLSFAEPLRDANGDPAPAPGALQFTSPPAVLNALPKGHDVFPAATIEVTFDRPVDQATTAAAFQITPPAAGRFVWRETTLIFVPEGDYLDEYTDYTITVGTGARDADGQPLLSNPYEWSFRTGQMQDVANFGWGPNAQVLDVDGRRAVQFQLFQTAVNEVTFELYRLNLEQFLDRYASGFRGSAGWENDRPISTAGTSLVKSWTVTQGVSPVQYSNIQEVIIPPDVAPGLYILNLRSGFINDQLILLLSRNAVMVKQAGRQLVAWVSDINGGPIAATDVAIYARDGELIREGQTDALGVFRTQVERDAQPLIVIAGRGDDLTASGLSNEWRSSGSQWTGWWQDTDAAPSFAAHIYTDRPIYRPGQQVFFKAIIRQDDDALLELLPEGTSVTVRIRDARNNVVKSYDLATNNFGTVHGAFELAEGAMLGEYVVELVVDRESQRQVFEVEEYQKPDYQVTVGTNRQRFIAGDTVEVTIDTAYFFGEPVPGADIVVNLFQLGERYWWDENIEGDYFWYPEYEPVKQGRTDANGRFTFSFAADLGYQSQPVTWNSNLEQSIWAVEATVDDGSHQTVSGFQMIRVFNNGEKVRLDTGGYLHEPGEAFTIRAEVSDIFDRPVGGQELLLTLRRWNRNSYDYEIVMQSSQLTSDANGQASILWTVDEPGFYQIRLSGRDSRNHPIEYNSYLYAFKNSFGGWYGRDSELAISADRTEYAPGDTARLLIESRFSGPALLTFERAKIRREQLIELTAPVTLVEVEIQPDDTPNIHVTVNAWEEQDTTLQEQSYGSLPDSRLHVASTDLSVPVRDKSLNVIITPDQVEYAPRQEATFTVRVTNQAGIPVSAEISLAMVDEAIFALSDDLSGAIFDAFYYPRENYVQTFDALALIRYLGGGMGGGGGDGPLAGGPRSDFPDTAEWFPELHTDFNGEAQVTVTLPDSLTSWRLTAKATTADTQVGETYLNVLTRQTIVVRPILPRVLTAGDQVNLSAIIHNYSDSSQQIEVRLLSDDTYLDQAAGPETISLAPGRSSLVGWSMTALNAGQTQITVQAEIGGIVWDAIQLPLLIQPLAVPDVATQVGQFRGELATTVEMPAGALPMSSVRLEISRSIAGTLLEGLEFLTGFPYGCVEQTMSRALPNAVVGRALNQLGVTNPTLQADLPGKVNASLQRLYGYQHNDGGWGWWYDDSSHDYQTAWVIFGLAMIADAGYEVDRGVIERGVTWLNEALSGMDIRTRAYALYSMAMAGSPNLEETLALADQLAELDTFSQAGLALALAKAGQPARAGTVLDVLAETAVTRPDGRVYWTGTDYDGAYYQKTMASATRSTALALSAFAQIRPGHSLEPGIVNWLMSQRQLQGWGSTNETSYAILGLTDHLLATSFAEAAVATQYTVLLNGETIASGSLGRGEPAVSLELPVEALQSGINQLRVSQSGQGPLYFVINRRAYLAQEAIEAAGGVAVKRAYLDPETGQKIDTIEAGQLVEVRLTVSMAEQAAYVMVEDRLPGGLVALNERLNTSSHVAASYEEPHYYWQSYGYNYKEVRDDRVTFFITELEEGQHIFGYMARATHAGQYVAMPAEVSAMYNLAVWGRSASAPFLVTD